MLGRLRIPVLIVSIWLPAHVEAGTAPATLPADAADRAEAERIVRQLDDPDPDVRRLAQLRINNLGAGGLEPMERATEDEDASPEAKVRLKVALKYLRPRAAREGAERARVAWESAAFRAAYLAGGHTNPKWDADVKTAINGYISLGADPRQAPAAAHDAAVAAFERAYDVGCDDTMVLSLYCLADTSPGGPTRMHQDDRRLNILGRFFQGNYPPAVRFRAAAQFAAAQDVLSDVLIHMLTSILPKVVGTPDLPTSEIDTAIDWLIVTRFTYLPVQEEWEKLLDALEQAEPDSPFPLLARSHTRQIIAWERRNSRSDDRTTQEFAKELKEALDLAERAIQRKPNDSRVARWLLTMQFQLAELGDTKAEFEKWFELTMQLDPDDRSACEAKLQYLKITGSTEQVIDFGHECLASENWRGQIPLVAVSAHERVAELSDDRQAYFLKPEVWKDIHDVFEGELVNYPRNLLRRCEYAKYAALCGQWKTASQQLNLVGDKPVISVFGSEASYQYLRRKAERLAKEASSSATKP